MKALGTHTLIDYYDCDPETLKAPARIRDILLAAIRRSGMTIVIDTFHSFEPQGVSGVVVIAESHVTIHTWPEHGYVAMDVFTCGNPERYKIIESEVRTGLKSTRVSSKSIARGGVSEVCEDDPRPRSHGIDIVTGRH
jgi:S-adenosylmethionine decarboxylase